MLCCYKLWQMPNFCPKNLLELLDQKWFFATLCCCCSECQKQKLENPTLAQIIKIQTFSKFIHQIHQFQRFLKLQFNIIRHNQPKILWKWHFKKCIPKPSAIAFEEELWRRPPWHCTNVSLSLKVAQGWWLVAWLCKTSLKNVSQGSSQNHLGKTWTILINSIHYSGFHFKIRLKTFTAM